MKKLSNLKEENPDFIIPPELEELEKQFDQLADIEVLASTPGGKVLAKLLMDDVVSSISSLLSIYRNATHTELLSHIADISSNLNTVRLLKNAKESKEVLQAQLDEELANALSE